MSENAEPDDVAARREIDALLPAVNLMLPIVLGGYFEIDPTRITATLDVITHGSLGAMRVEVFIDGKDLDESQAKAASALLREMGLTRCELKPSSMAN